VDEQAHLATVGLDSAKRVAVEHRAILKLEASGCPLHGVPGVSAGRVGCEQVSVCGRTQKKTTAGRLCASGTNVDGAQGLVVIHSRELTLLMV
jgi:hypothetical protein